LYVFVQKVILLIGLNCGIEPILDETLGMISFRDKNRIKENKAKAINGY